jgi:hypothetical protein
MNVTDQVALIDILSKPYARAPSVRKNKGKEDESPKRNQKINLRRRNESATIIVTRARPLLMMTIFTWMRVMVVLILRHRSQRN